MKEQLMNFVYVFPFLIPMGIAGAMSRFSRRGKPGGWRVTVIGAAVTAVVWLIALPLSHTGSELPGIIAGFVTGFPIGAAVCGIGLRLRRISG
ncbi:hypothetical protein [uncultured Oscillibacter sp.]|uniref:hypothetical protein n=1 Tax=uncultured Oscillibacter sp. TaxID=876091 RepID=UPI0025DE3EBE|nr:hypothetical protein [uncultured Oscillibacter sp.]